VMGGAVGKASRRLACTNADSRKMYDQRLLPSKGRGRLDPFTSGIPPAPHQGTKKRHSTPRGGPESIKTQIGEVRDVRVS